jgi:hypothetical protein
MAVGALVSVDLEMDGSCKVNHDAKERRDNDDRIVHSSHSYIIPRNAIISMFCFEFIMMP